MANSELQSNPFVYQKVDAGAAQTYVKITHHNPESIKNTKPNEFGIQFIPFPYMCIRPAQSVISGDKLPKCKECGAYINRYNFCQGYNFKCPICQTSTQSHIPFEIDGNEFISDVYEAYCSSQNMKRNAFEPTEYFFVSTSLLETHPNILDIIHDCFVSCYNQKQVAIAFLHGAITIVKFRNLLSFQTFAIETPVARLPQLFIPTQQFMKHIPLLKRKASELKFIENSNFPQNLSKYAVAASKPFGTTVRFILDDHGFHSFFEYTNELKKDALEACRNGSQFSLFAFTDKVSYRNPLFQYSSITGGHFKIFPNDIDGGKLRAEMMECLKTSVVHETYIVVRMPSFAEIIDCSGSGFLETHNTLIVPKIKVGDSFFFKFNAKQFNRPFIQFVVFFTSDIGIRKFRIVTVPIKNYPHENLMLQSLFVASFAAQKILVDEVDDISPFLETMKQKYGEKACEKAKSLMNCDDYGKLFQRALEFRTPEKFGVPIQTQEDFSQVNYEV
ncbi:hypothetical protein TRFO_22715 [Tritrichomonas foetus]|uniref:Zinc finger Sec23/Sec24-type domain-containing protein n=1 Tax=Tritrichomonas foetus TaxID=1144522 RepID=A0A1J4KB43_9EUKA|nr:hypothetical protein TRFO_22715 [Tritrichomonas foetus]|eukprot:OHT08639.1 hypothetical protein TRFO_22715 [Tritrichomonas foetus]